MNRSPAQFKTILVIFILLSTYFFGPIAYGIGTILMWKVTNWPKWVKILLSLPLVVMFFIFIFLLVSLYFVRPVQVKGEAMLPNYKDGAFYLTSVLHTASPIQRNDVVIVSPPKNPKIEYIKRVIGVPGDQIEIKGGLVYLNNSLLDESYLDPGTKTNVWVGGYIQEGQKITLADNQYFVMGDNRSRSADSREFGLVSKDTIHSKALFCYWNCR